MLDYPEYQVPLPGMTDWEEIAAEYSIQGFSARIHPMQIIRGGISTDGVSTSTEVLGLADGDSIRTAGYVVCRQAPRTAKGHVFLTLEDEEGLLNIILKPNVYQQYRYAVRTQPLLIIDGIVQKREGITNIIAKHIAPLRPNHERDDVAYSYAAPKARNFC
jgi:error-prone DNA polymerase